MKEEMMYRLIEAVREVIETECTVYFRKVKKNNGMIRNFIEIRETGMNVFPAICIDSMMERVEAGELSLHDAAGKIVGEYKTKKGVCSPRIRQCVSAISREYILERVTYKLVNGEKNAGCLADMPHKEFLDMVAVYRVIVDSTGVNASIAVTQALCGQFGITEGELDIAARRNTRKEGFRVRLMESVLTELMDIPEETSGLHMGIWVVSNPTMYNGAAAMLFPGCFRSLAEQLGSDLYILPSSIHEVIAISTENMEPNILRDMVHTVNVDKVIPDEVLSNNVYRYSLKDGSVSIA